MLVSSHDGFEPLLQKSHSSQPACRNGHRSIRCIRNKINRIQQSFRVRSPITVILPNDPRITALLFMGLDLSDGKPDNGMPPEQRRANDFQNSDPLIASLKVS